MILPTVLGVLGAGLTAWGLRRRGLDRWLLPYLLQAPKRRPPEAGRRVHVLLCVADHYEPDWGGPTPDVAQGRVDAWARNYPRLFGRFRDSDGRPPQHTFFYPLETYTRDHLDALAGLCHDGFGEVEVHLHHDRDTAAGLRGRLLDYKETLADRHGLLARHPETGEIAYGFIHGNWALDNARPDGRWCGVCDELSVLAATGCYADFTLPAAPSRAQTRTINSIYYARGRPGKCKSHDTGVPVGYGAATPGALMMIQGPLLLDWSRRKWGLLPRTENACLQGSQPPTMERLDLWLRARVHVSARPDWLFVKLHTHGAPEKNQRVLLGEPAARFHEGLARRADVDENFRFHYVTAREMYNLARAAEAGWRGSVAEARDFVLRANGRDVGSDPSAARDVCSCRPAR